MITAITQDNPPTPSLSQQAYNHLANIEVQFKAIRQKIEATNSFLIQQEKDSINNYTHSLLAESLEHKQKNLHDKLQKLDNEQRIQKEMVSRNFDALKFTASKGFLVNCILLFFLKARAIT